MYGMDSQKMKFVGLLVYRYSYLYVASVLSISYVLYVKAGVNMEW